MNIEKTVRLTTVFLNKNYIEWVSLIVLKLVIRAFLSNFVLSI